MDKTRWIQIDLIDTAARTSMVVFLIDLPRCLRGSGVLTAYAPPWVVTPDQLISSAGQWRELNNGGGGPY